MHWKHQLLKKLYYIQQLVCRCAKYCFSQKVIMHVSQEYLITMTTRLILACYIHDIQSFIMFMCLITACKEAHPVKEDQNACIMGCNNQLPFATKHKGKVRTSQDKDLKLPWLQWLLVQTLADFNMKQTVLICIGMS